MDSFTFPFTTCETSSSLLQQPWSAAINAITCIILIIFAYIDKRVSVKMVLSSYALFEAWHTLSHVKHIPGNIQTNVVHVLGYVMGFATLFAILALSNSDLSTLGIIIISIFVLIDLYVWVFVKGLWTVITGLSIFAVIVLVNYNNLSPLFKAYMPFLIIGLFIIFLLFMNETYNCSRMMEHMVFPYHIAIEIVGLILFTTLAYLFSQWK